MDHARDLRWRLERLGVFVDDRRHSGSWGFAVEGAAAAEQLAMLRAIPNVHVFRQQIPVKAALPR